MGTDRRVVITGAAGFLGRYSARHFAGKGWRVIGIDRLPRENAPEGLTSYHCLSLPDACFNGLLTEHRPHLCIHFAGGASVGQAMSDPSTDFHSGPYLIFEVLNSLRLHAPDCGFLFPSSAAVYGTPFCLPVKETHPCAPLSSYGYHKMQGEMLCAEFSKIYGLRTASLRIFSAYGSGLKRQVIWDICRKAVSEEKLLLQGTGRESRDFVHASDIAAAMEVLAESALMQGEIYNLGSGREVSIHELSGMLLDMLGSGKTPLFDGIVPQGTPINWQADISLLSGLGFRTAISLEQGLQSFVDWFKREVSGR